MNYSVPPPWRRAEIRHELHHTAKVDSNCDWCVARLMGITRDEYREQTN